MKLAKHTEYQSVYVTNNAAFERCREAIVRWRVSNDTLVVPYYALNWTYGSARAFVSALSQLFQAYNHVLWQTFHYCQQCGGQCCVAGASYAPAFDMLALALLDHSVPILPENITARERECIYLAHRRCSWPEEWRTIKCWSFYCLGPVTWQAGVTRIEMYRPIIAELQRVVCALLPTELRVYEIVHNLSLADSLDDPIKFSEVLHQALFEIFVGPLNEVHPFLETPENGALHASGTVQDINVSDSFLFSENVSAFITEVVERACEFPPQVPEDLDISVEQLLEDLELLLWIIEGRPSHTQRLLTEIAQRYINAPAPEKGAEPSVWYCVRDAVAQLSHH
jgi:hypothetical protein